MCFLVWSAAVSAQSTVKATAGAVSVPIVVGGQVVRPNNAVLADDDGVVRVRKSAPTAYVCDRTGCSGQTCRPPTWLCRTHPRHRTALHHPAASNR